MSVLSPQWQRPEILASILDQLSDALILYDKDLRIVGVNQAGQRLFGMSIDAMVGKHSHELFHCNPCEPGSEAAAEER